MQLTRPEQKTNSPNKASGEKSEEKVEKEFASFCCKNSCRSRNQSNFNASKEDLRTYPYKMRKRHELSTTHERMRLVRCQHILNLMKDGTVPNLVFMDEKEFDIQQCLNHQNDRVWSRDGSVEGRRVTRHQNALSVMVWAAISATGRSPLVFVPSGTKLNRQRYILKAELLPWACKHFDGAPWTLQQDSAPSHSSKMTQSWIQAHIPAFISKDE